jgi:hypothetical protein
VSLRIWCADATKIPIPAIFRINPASICNFLNFKESKR